MTWKREAVKMPGNGFNMSGQGEKRESRGRLTLQHPHKRGQKVIHTSSPPLKETNEEERDEDGDQSRCPDRYDLSASWVCKVRIRERSIEIEYREKSRRGGGYT